jgi:hypothetical protein
MPVPNEHLPESRLIRAFSSVESTRQSRFGIHISAFTFSHSAFGIRHPVRHSAFNSAFAIRHPIRHSPFGIQFGIRHSIRHLAFGHSIRHSAFGIQFGTRHSAFANADRPSHHLIRQSPVENSAFGNRPSAIDAASLPQLE